MDRLQIFLKMPQPGRVKTRLAQSLGAEAACSAYQSLVDDLVSNLAGIGSVEIRVSPDDGRPGEIGWLRDGWRVQGQGQGDLGERLDRGFRSAFEAGCRRVLAIGSDCPYVTEDLIREALESVAEDTLVLGPAPDGGYWLIGMGRHAAALFEGIEWSTESVFDATCQRAEQLGLRVQQLPVLEDIDDLEAWNRYTTKKKS